MPVFVLLVVLWFQYGNKNGITGTVAGSVVGSVAGVGVGTGAEGGEWALHGADVGFGAGAVSELTRDTLGQGNGGDGSSGIRRGTRPAGEWRRRSGSVHTDATDGGADSTYMPPPPTIKKAVPLL